jgi:hypothetical protein
LRFGIEGGLLAGFRGIGGLLFLVVGYGAGQRLGRRDDLRERFAFPSLLLAHVQDAVICPIVHFQVVDVRRAPEQVLEVALAQQVLGPGDLQVVKLRSLVTATRHDASGHGFSFQISSIFSTALCFSFCDMCMYL